MIKETRALVRLLRAKLHKGLAHQWFLNQYVLRHHLEKSVIFTKELLYNRNQRTIAFKNGELADMALVSTKIKKRRNKKLIPRYSAENASLVLLKNIRTIGGGWLGTIVVCSTCFKPFRSAWSPPGEMNIDQLHKAIVKFLINPRPNYETACKCSKKKLLTACKPIFFKHPKTGKINPTIGVIDNSFLLPKKLYHIETLARISGDKFQQVALANSPFGGGAVPTPQPNLNNLSKTLFGTLIQLMCFWLKNGNSEAQKLIERYVSPSMSNIIPENLTIRLAPLHTMSEQIQFILTDRHLRDRLRILVPGRHRVTFLRNQDGPTFFVTHREDTVYTPSRFIETFALEFFQIIDVIPMDDLLMDDLPVDNPPNFRPIRETTL